MPYGNDPANSETDQIRALLRDTSTGSPMLTDSEVSWLAESHQNVYFAASMGASMIAGQYADEETTKKVGDLSWSKKSPTEAYTALSRDLHRIGATRGVVPYVGGISVSDVEANDGDADWARTDIGLEMGHDDGNNPGVWS